MSPQPDVVIVVIDDVGFADLGCYGAEIRTPNIDALAATGLRFNRFETRAICTPSRAALLSGRNPHAIGMADLPAMSREQAETSDSSFRGVLPDDIELLPESLRRRGYRTVALGKWHLAPEYGTETEHHASWPLARGFDEFYGFIGGHTDQFSPRLVSGTTPVDPPTVEGYHLTEDLVDHAIGALTSDAPPTFLYLATGAAHSPHQVPDDYLSLYRGRYDDGWDVAREHRLERQIALGVVPRGTVLAERNPGDPAWSELGPRRRRVAARFQEIYAAFIEHTDAQLGRLFNHVREGGRDTIVILLSDNGPAPEGGDQGSFRRLYADPEPLADVEAHIDELGTRTTTPMYPRPWAMVGATPFRRYKLWPLAGGVRTPLIISWQGHIPDPGSIRPQYVEVVDIAPTVLEWVGGGPSGTGAAPPADGASIARVLVDPDALTRSVQYFELRSNRAIVSGDWKAVALHVPGTAFDDDRWLLFHHATDFSESRDLASEHPEVLSALVEEWHRQAARYVDPPLREMPSLLRGLHYFDDGYPPGQP